jgi:hypothetical protein
MARHGSPCRDLSPHDGGGLRDANLSERVSLAALERADAALSAKRKKNRAAAP